MKVFFAALSFILVFLVQNVHAQITYTSNGTCTSLTNGSCWTRELTGTCTTNLDIPLLTGTEACPVNIVINHPIDVIGDLTLGSNVNLTVNAGGILNIGGSLSIAGSAKNTSINVSGGSINLTGNLNLNSGTNNVNGKTNLTINITNSGKFNVSGGMILDNDVILSITGDKTGSLNVNSLELNQRSEINILSGGRLLVNNNVEFKGQNSGINVSGLFKTSGSVLITGGVGNQLNALGDGKIEIGGNLVVGGTSNITFGGNSEIDIAGNIDISGNASVVASGTSSVYVCGSVDEKFGGTVLDCRLLPVEYTALELSFHASSRSIKLSWATAKEWENSHFEIQRAVGINPDFQTIGEVAGIGWSDQEVKYIFEDTSLPLFETQVYYRLKQVDFDGTASLSKVLALKVTGMPDAAGTWRAYPNPSNGQRIQVGLLNAIDYQSGQLAFQLNSALVSTGLVQVQDQRELNEKLGILSETLPNGMYVLDIHWDQNIQKIKLIIRK
jgi:hypothetical protein